MVGQISHQAGQELAQISRKKRGPFQRSQGAQQPSAHEDVVPTRRSKKASSVSRNHEAVTITKSIKPELPHNYNMEVPIPVATLIHDAVTTGNDAATGVSIGLNGRAVGHLSLLALQDVAQPEEQASAPAARQTNGQANGQANGLALGHDKDRNSRAAAPERPEQASEPVSVKVARPKDDSGTANFVKRYEHRDYNAEVALSLLSGGKEQARDASLSVKFQAYAESASGESQATGESKDVGFVQQFLNGAEKV